MSGHGAAPLVPPSVVGADGPREVTWAQGSSLRRWGVAATRTGDGALLLMRRRAEGAWALPGGHVKLGETWTAAACRECREETGWRVRIDGILGVYSDPATQRHRYPSGQQIHFVGVVFEATVESCEGGRDNEATDVGFFALDALPEPLWAPDREVLADLRSSHPRPFIR